MHVTIARRSDGNLVRRCPAGWEPCPAGRAYQHRCTAFVAGAYQLRDLTIDDGWTLGHQP